MLRKGVDVLINLELRVKLQFSRQFFGYRVV